MSSHMHMTFGTEWLPVLADEARTIQAVICAFPEGLLCFILGEEERRDKSSARKCYVR